MINRTQSTVCSARETAVAINSSVTKPVGELLSNHVQTRLFCIKHEADINLLRTGSSTYRDSDCGQSHPNN